MIDLLCIDGNGAAFRHAATAQSKIAAQGAPVDGQPSVPAVVPFAILELVLKLVHQFNPRRVVLCWDTKGSWLRRQQIFAGYKSTRKTKERTPEEELFLAHYKQQLGHAQTLMYLLGVDQAAGPWFEADDLLAWYARRAAPGTRTLVVSGDKDLGQLVDDRVNVYDCFKQRLLSPANFTAEVGVPLDRFVEYLCLRGDASDGIPGIPQVGDVTALNWLGQYLTAEEIAANVTKPPLATKNLRENLETIRRNRLLIDLSWVESVATIPERRGVLNLRHAYQVCNWLQMRSTLDRWGTVEGVFQALRRQAA